MSKYDVPKQRATAIRKALQLPASTPVRFARHGTSFKVLPVDNVGATCFDPRDCAIEHAYERVTGHTALIGNRETALVRQVSDTTKVEVTVYATGRIAGRKLADFDAKSEPMTEGTVTFLPWPTSWYPKARAKMARDLAEKKKKPDYAPRPYTLSGDHGGKVVSRPAFSKLAA